MPGRENVRVAVSGGTPGADSADYVLFDSTVCFTSGLESHDISRIEFAANNSQAGSLKAYFSQDRGVTWNLYNTQAVVASSAGAMAGPFDYLVDPYRDFRLIWTNGGVAQATWIPSIVLIRNYHGAAA
jgi:hypothetical protein